MNTDTLDDLAPIQNRIASSESESIVARWEFGHVLIKQRKGKQLPNGLRQKVADHFGLEASEITRRMQLADKFAAREEVHAACEKHGGSWRQIIAEELIKHRDTPKLPSPWEARAMGRLDKLVSEAVVTGRRDELVVLLERSLKSLRGNGADVGMAA
ncbi:hypothetical protein AB4Z39_28875 [Mycobacterium adipatum]|uniref:hypothetical protein n=1 Tax=Mycobacterium adipatum TaxID=1682113 RepID=UPI0034E0BF0E